MGAVDPTVIMRHFDTIATILQTLSILMGIFICLTAFFMLKRHGESRTMMSHQSSLIGPVMTLIAGCMLLILPTFIASLMQTVFSTSSPLAYSTGSAFGYAEYVPVVLMFVRLVGVVSIIRGILLISRSGGQNAQHGTIGRAMTHIIGGLLAVHIGGTIHLLREILDLTVT